MLRLKVSDMTGDLAGRLRVSADWTIAQVRPQFLEALWPSGVNWPEGDGFETTWNLYNVSAPGQPMLADSDRVGDVLQDGHEVRVEPNMTAGGLAR